MLLFLTLLLLIGLTLWVRLNEVSIGRKIALFGLQFLLILLTSLEIISDQFTGAGFNESVIYHLQYGLRGAGIREFIPVIVLSSFALLFALSSWLYFFFTKTSTLRARPVAGWYVAIGLALASIIGHPAFKKIVDFQFPQTTNQPLIDFYVRAAPSFRPTRPPNLVWIYAESLERSYLDEAIFPGLMPRIRELETRSLSFTNIDQFSNTGWTIAGIVASQCGIPLVTTGSSGNSMHSLPRFLPGALCFGDVLAKESYSLTFMGGADLEFAGKGKFLETHGFKNIYGSKELLPYLANPAYVNGWGLYDDTLFYLAKSRFKELVAKESPFGLFVLTLDTHHPHGILSGTCDNFKYKDGTNSLLNAVHCSDHLIVEFIEEIVRADPNTLIVLASDHLAMKNDAYDKLALTSRKNLLLFHWPDHVSHGLISREGETFSIGATALDIMGFENKGVGLGRSLIGKAGTIRELFEEPQAIVNSWAPEFRKLWNIPQNPKLLHIDAHRRSVYFSGSQYQLPLIVDLSRTESFPRLFYDDADLPLSAVIRQLGPETHSIWIDSCDRVFATIKQFPDGDPIATCVWDDKMKSIIQVDDTIDYALN